MKNSLSAVSISNNDIELLSIHENFKLTVRIDDVREKCFQQVRLARGKGDIVKVVYREYCRAMHYAEFSIKTNILSLNSQVSSDPQFNSNLVTAVASDILTILATTRSTKFLKVTRT